MGNYLRIFRRRRPPSEELDKLVIQIRELDTQLKHLLESRTWSLKWLLFLSFFLTTVGSAYYWFQYPILRRKFLSISAVISLGCVSFFTLRFGTITFYDWLIDRKQRRIKIFTERKVAIIEDIKENEKFKVAKEIIEKYGSESEVNEWLGPSASSKVANGSKNNSMPPPANNEGREREMLREKPVPKLYEIRDGHLTNSHRSPVRPFLEPSRTPIDRMLDFVMGESINNRYALICANCHGHNGMALKEEFETISYYCFKCNFFNPSKAEMNKRKFPHFTPRQLDFTGHTDESTENEVESIRKASTASLNTEEISEQEDATLGKE